VIQICTCSSTGRNLRCPFHGDAAQIFNRPDQEQLARIEAKLDMINESLRHLILREEV
jgi:hypothetical protein